VFAEQGMASTHLSPISPLTLRLVGLPKTAASQVTSLQDVATRLLSTFAALRMPLPTLITKRLKALVANASLATASTLADLLVSTLCPSHADKLAILSLTCAEQRVTKALEILSRVNEEVSATKSISDRVQGNLDRAQREFFLRQQLAAISQELRELEGKGRGRGAVDGAATAGTGPDDSEADDELKEVEKKIEAAQMEGEALQQATVSADFDSRPYAS
jgi:ATP-dependent Lon protease